MKSILVKISNNVIYKKLINVFKNPIPSKVEWSILIGICLLLFLSYMYVDILYPTRNGMTFLKVLFNGHLYEFYQYALNTPISSNIPSTPTYDLNIYILFGIWNFPLYLLEVFGKINVFTNILALLWAKSILIVFLIGTLWILYKICHELNISKTNTKWCLFIFLSSSFVFSSLFLLCQLDVISIFFSLLGLLMYIKGDFKKFIFWFAIAISFKLFALFIFIPLLLLKEKRIIRLITYIFIGVSITLFFKIIFISAPGIDVTKEFTAQMIGFLTKNTLNISVGTISLFVFSMFVLFIYCYIKNIKNAEELKRYAIYIPFLSYSIFFLFSYTHPYWIILLAPYFAIMIFQNIKCFKINLLIEMISSVALIFAQTIVFYWCFSAKAVLNTVITKIFPVDFIYKDKLVDYNMTILTNKMSELSNGSVVTVALSIFAAGIIGLLVINFPHNLKDSNKETLVIERGLIISRLAISFALCLIPLICYLTIAAK